MNEMENNVNVAEVAVKKPSGKKIALICAIAAVIVAGAAAIGIFTASSSPLTLVGQGAVNSLAALEKNELVQLMTAVSEGGSAELTCDLKKLTESAIGFGVDGNASVKIYRNTEPRVTLVANVDVGGMIKLDGTAMVRGNEIVLASDALLGEKAYGVNLETADEKFASSVFGPDGIFSLGVESLKELTGGAENAAQMSEDGKKVAEEFLAVLLASVKEHAEISKEKDSLSFGGAETETTAVLIRMDGPALGEFLLDMIEYMRTSETLRNFMYTYSDTVAAALLDSDLVDDYDESSEAVDEFYEKLDEVAAEVEEARAEFAESTEVLTVTCHVTNSDKQLVGVKVHVADEGEGEELSTGLELIAGPSLERVDEIRLRYYEYDSEAYLSYSVTENTENKYSAELTVSEYDEVLASGVIDWNRADGSLMYTVMDEYGELYGMTGSITHGEETTVIGLDSVHAEGESVALGMKLILTRVDEMPEMLQYTDVMSMSADEVLALVEEIEGTIGGLQMLVNFLS